MTICHVKGDTINSTVPLSYLELFSLFYLLILVLQPKVVKKKKINVFNAVIVNRGPYEYMKGLHERCCSQ